MDTKAAVCMAVPAFPLLLRGGTTANVAVDVSTVELLRAAGFANPTCSDWLFRTVSGRLSPVTVVGGTSPRDALLHLPGLPAAVSVPAADLARHRDRFFPATAGHSDQSELAAFAAVAVVADWVSNDSSEVPSAADVESAVAPPRSFFHRWLWEAWQRETEERGLAAIVAAGRRFSGGVRRDLAYYVCDGGDDGAAPAVRHTFDTSDAAIAQLAPAGGPPLRHGLRVLSPRGTAVCVGVCTLPDVGAPALLWHRQGAPGASLAPCLHAPRSHFVSVNAPAVLPQAGPPPDSPLLFDEDLSHYLVKPSDDAPSFDGRLRSALDLVAADSSRGVDRSAWLCKGLFGAAAGQSLADFPAFRAEGVYADRATGQLELLVSRPSAAGVREYLPHTDVLLYEGSPPITLN